MKYTTKKGQQGEQVLQIDGIDSICPFVSGIPLQNNMGGLQVLRMPCSTQCPHAKVVVDESPEETTTSYHVGCSGDLKVFELEKPTVETPKSEPKIIKI
jgi:hypothetical protein